MNVAGWIIFILVLPVIIVALVIRASSTRIALRALHRSHSRVDRFKLTKKALVKETLLADEVIAAAVKEHAAECSMDEAAVWQRVEAYIDEIVPFFNILTYYKIGLVVSKALLSFFYKVSAEYASESIPSARPAVPSSQSALPRDATV